MKPSPGGSFATLTHARLRAAQGDVGGALRILRVILAVQPDHEEAQALLNEIEGRAHVTHTEPEGAAAEPVRSATAEGLSGRFRDALGRSGGHAPVDRLTRWLERTQRNRGEHDAR